MPWDAFQIGRLIHVAASSLWIGGLLFHLLILTPAVRATGPAAGPLMRTVLRRGGFGRYYGILAATSILSGLYVYSTSGYASAPFANANNASVTVGVALGILAFVLALTLNLPLEAQMKRLEAQMPREGPPSAEQGQRMQALAQRAVPRAVLVAGLVAAAFLAMVGRHLVA